jgi:ribosomal protein S12 methylthiotransferase
MPARKKSSATSSSPAMPKVGLVSLGCAKNLVDSEIMLGALSVQGYPITSEIAEADVVIVNTCSFIDAAKDESIAAVLEANRARGMRKQRQHQKLIVAGCMAQRFQNELPELLPEVDAFIGLDQVATLAEIVRQVWQDEGPRSHVTARPRYIPDWDTPRVRLTQPHTAYVKIAEGCNHPCSFCIIPRMRGKHRSRTVASIVQEAKQLLAQGVKELNLISQDTTYFGMDRWEKAPGPRAPADPEQGESLVQLLEALDRLKGDFWVRLLYTHPAHWSDALIRCIARSRHVVPYVDIPLQHIHEDMLKNMRRETSEAHIVDLIRRLREGIPGLGLRTTFIVGFPGETEAHFKRLLEFIRASRFERLGIFTYSQEEGTRAALLPGQIPPATRRKRHDRAMALQQKLAAEVQASRVGSRLRVLVERPGVARSVWDAPDIDGRVYCPEHLPVGQFADVLITGASEYDLWAEGVSPKRTASATKKKKTAKATAS